MALSLNIVTYANDTYTFNEALDWFNKNRRISGALNGSQYALHHPGEVAISQEEINALLADRSLSGSVTREQAIQDADLYFRALKYCYGGYYYFGEANFENAKNSIIAQLGQKNSISGKELGLLIQNNLPFVRDAHFKINNVSMMEILGRYQAYYCDLQFAWDSSGYYVEENGAKWYFLSCDNPNTKMQYLMTDGGELVYSPIQFCVAGQAVPESNVTVTNGTESKNLKARWRATTPYPVESRPDVKCISANGVVYISVREFHDANGQALQQFVNSANIAKNGKLVILDIRGNNGGSDEYPMKWVETFTGQKPEIGGYHANYDNALSTHNARPLGQEKNDARGNSGRKISNKIPLIILVDNQCASSGESALMFARLIDNAVVIGCNSSGYQLVGNVETFSLPNSGIRASFGRNLNMYYDYENVDGKGYTPDIWCNPANAAPALCNVLKKNGMIDDATIQALTAGGMK